MERQAILVDSSVVVNAFDNTSDAHDICYNLILKLQHDNFDILMPMHALFEIHCAMERLTKIDNKHISNPFNSKNPIQFKPIPIDDKFINNYHDPNLPYVKSGDFIFLAIAKKLSIPFITSDKPLHKKSKECKLEVYFPEEFIKTV